MDCPVRRSMICGYHTVHDETPKICSNQNAKKIVLRYLLPKIIRFNRKSIYETNAVKQGNFNIY